MQNNYSLSHYECDGHTVDKLTEWHCTAKEVTSQNSVNVCTETLHQGHIICSSDIQNGWTQRKTACEYIKFMWVYILNKFYT